MSSRRILAAAALLTTTSLALTACGPTDTGATSTTTPPASSPSAPATPPSATAPSATATTRPTTTKPATTRPTAAADCTAQAQSPDRKVILAVSANKDASVIIARDTKVICHEGKPWETQYVPTGSTSNYPTLTETTAQLVTATGKMDEYKNVTIERLEDHITTCTKHRQETPPFKCYGNLYAVTLDSAGQIISILEMHS